jgi:hypothetical protein
MLKTTSLMLLASILAAGCGGHHNGGGGGHYEAPAPTPVSGLSVFYIDAGAPTLVDANNPGFAITANVGGSYRVVWTGNVGGWTRFQGYIYSQSGFGAVYPGCSSGECQLEAGDDYMDVLNYSGGGQYIQFDTLAADGFDGVDFTTPADPVEFDFYIDGRQYPTSVFFTSGGVLSNTDVFPFGLAIQ